ncbi:MAG: LysR family transcriptional regulator [Chloroflexi bacterium]|nr:LysR family transcriptional regulator [Chloroflexota bacterium]MBT5893124.1 LysR family transcriptional regulator [Chloroflexota bacterium]MBT6706907.1 LysR family transcriptional regulator [Chloroflexota bacterium]MBT7079349.1 LysR family transcriptional regulator [Chloroflexota bacterium]MBT7833203.1 LysR family transcriptional regulator [Chloroflexota bacterium]
MNIPELEALRAVAKTGSFMRAADRLGMSQPGLSRQIQRLERELGI